MLRKKGGRERGREIKGEKNKQSACLASAIPGQTPELFALGGGGVTRPFLAVYLEKTLNDVKHTQEQQQSIKQNGATYEQA